MRRGGVNPFGHDMIDRKLDVDAARFRVGLDPSRSVELVVFHE